jgi:hypothetical protein
MERYLRPDRVTKTADQLTQWIGTEFATSHLCQVAFEVQTFTQEAVAKAQSIRRPIWPLRIGVWLLLCMAAAGIVYHFLTQPSQTLKFLDETKGAAAYITGAVILLISLEVRWKRRKALQAVNDLRALAHIVDMHQVAKDEAIQQFRDDGNTEKTVAYLHACSALLALLSKVGQLYVEHFPDPVATSAVNDFETITTGMANKTWLKILSMKKPALDGGLLSGNAK